eukprot:10349229-Alexandrium_andersonii.AAC.1
MLRNYRRHDTCSSMTKGNTALHVNVTQSSAMNLFVPWWAPHVRHHTSRETAALVSVVGSADVLQAPGLHAALGKTGCACGRGTAASFHHRLSLRPCGRAC